MFNNYEKINAQAQLLTDVCKGLDTPISKFFSKETFIDELLQVVEEPTLYSLFFSMVTTYLELVCSPSERTLISIKQIAKTRLIANENGGSVFAAMLDIAKERIPKIEQNPDFIKCQEEFSSFVELAQEAYTQEEFYKQISSMLDEFALKNNLGIAEDDAIYTNVVSNLKSVVQKARYDFREKKVQ